MNFAERFVQAAAKEFGEPEKQCAKNRECRRDAHDKMEMAGDEIVADGTGGKIVAREENPEKTPRKKKHNETNREKPEEAPPNNGNSIRDGGRRLIRYEIQLGEKVRAQQAIGEQTQTGREENAENQHAEDGVDEPGPNG